MPDNTDPKPENDDKAQTPPWGADFDAEKAWTLVQNLRNDKTGLQTKLTGVETELGTLKTAAQAAEDAKKTDEQKIADKLTAAEKAATEANRALFIERAKRKHSIPDDLDEFLTSDTEEGILAQAERLAGLQKPAASAEPKEEVDATGKPRPALIPGHSGNESEPFDHAAIAKTIIANKL